VDRDDERLVVASDQARAGSAGSGALTGGGASAGRQRVDDAADVLDAADLLAQPRDLAPHRRARDVEPAAVGVAHDEEERGVRVVAERFAQGLGRLLALGRTVGEAGRLEVLVDVVAERDRQDGEGADEGEHELGPSPCEIRDPREHRRDCTRVSS
jgi:hypothetical protein